MADPVHEFTEPWRPPEERQKPSQDDGKWRPKLISVRDFVDGFEAPDFLIEDMAQRRFLYSLTGRTGDGKTAVLTTLSLCLAAGQEFAGRRVEQGRVAYFAGENADDVRARTLMTAERLGVSLDDLPLYFLDKPFDIVGAREQIKKSAEELGGLDLVIVDTLAAFFQGEDENANVELGNFARDLRENLCTLPGGPSVIIACHPTKVATKSNLVPRGGGAFLAEVDGNLRVWSDDKETTELHWCGKLRGPGFEPIPFNLSKRTSDSVKDSKGRLIPNVVAEPLAETELQSVEAKARRDEDALLERMLNDPSGSMADWCRQLGWVGAKGEPYKSKVQRALAQLQDDRLVHKFRGRWTLTKAGKDEAKRRG
ncbi:hypothetical protein CKO28_09790 [Rhodovibrio sodomensis]|uniref:AAA+ ATPase domain-containing protein n=1 Tax=Rhodovibrio sodomensis TaxID=1088 RepID=A0ABS1DD44_9PROT|nr:AAA family ATPase [Rhodovibrio sodomensis]MBK1668325.1 hypothetical protein [Rhodovibrio sodomensis]